MRLATAERDPPGVTEILESLAEELLRFAVERLALAKLLAIADGQFPPSSVRDPRREFAPSKSILLTLSRRACSGTTDSECCGSTC